IDEDRPFEYFMLGYINYDISSSNFHTIFKCNDELTSYTIQIKDIVCNINKSVPDEIIIYVNKKNTHTTKYYGKNIGINNDNDNNNNITLIIQSDQNQNNSLNVHSVPSLKIYILPKSSEDYRVWKIEQ